MRLDGPDAYPQRLRDLLVTQTTRDHPQDLLLAFRQRSYPGSRNAFFLQPEVFADKHIADVSAIKVFALVRGPDGGEQAAVAGLLQDIAIGAQLERFGHILRVVIPGKEDDLRPRFLPQQPPSRLHPVDTR